MSNKSSLWGKYNRSKHDEEMLLKKIKILKKKRKLEKKNRKNGRRK